MIFIEKFSLTAVSMVIFTVATLFFVFQLNYQLALFISSAIMIRLVLYIREIQQNAETTQQQLITLKNRDILNKKSIEAKNRELEQKYFIDDLTQLPNRNALIDTIKTENHYTLILLNIDAFKDINDFYGHTAGDSLIKQLSIKLSQMPLYYEHTLYHVHVDELAFLINNSLNRAEIKKVIFDIEKYVQKHTFYASMRHSMLFTLSFGISLSHDESPMNHTLIMDANLALHFAKKHTHSWFIYEKELKKSNHYEENFYWLKKLQLAIEEDRIEPYFQPIVNKETKKISSHEALMRLVEKNGTAISPYLFLDIAKRSKLYTTLTRIMIEKTFDKFEKSKCCFSINFSYEDMIDKEILELLTLKLQKGNIGKRFTAEILESESISNYDLVKNFIDSIKAYGAKVAIDDFGSGYSNFERLFKLDIDYVKIDGSIIKDIDENEQLKIITETIVTFAKKTNIKVIAEFVHSQEIVDILEKMGVQQMQGYYFAEPSPEIITNIEHESPLELAL